MVEHKQAFTLYGYFRSSATWRVRLALGLKGYHMGDDSQIKYIPVHLVKGEQKSEEYAKLNPAKVSILTSHILPSSSQPSSTTRMDTKPS